MAVKKAKFLSSLVAVVIALGLVTCPTFAATKKKAPASRTAPKKRDTGQNAVVVVDGAAIYEGPNFDSPVLDYLDRGKTVFISKKVYRGVGGLGAFYKMRVRKGLFGYITDVDVQLSGGKVARKNEDRRGPPQANPDADPNDPTQIQPDISDEDSEDQSPGGVGLYFTRYFGAVIGQYNYTETVAKQSLSGKITSFGVKMTGSGSMLGGMPMDHELNVATKLPSEFFDKYYQSAKGFMLLGHSIALLPLVEKRNFALYYGLGLMGRFSKWDVVLARRTNKTPIDSQEFAIGAAAEFGMAYAFNPKFVMRADTRFYYERESYLGYAVAFQFKY